VSAETEALVAFALEALAATPDARVDDAYKWLFQATRGAEHAAASHFAAAAWLDREWDSLAMPCQPEPLVQSLRPDAVIVRLNLRPCRAQGMPRNDVLRAFLESAARFCGNASAFTDAWRALGVRLSEGEHGHLRRDRWQRLDVRMRASGYGPVHHSASYRSAYDPAYRVLRGVEARTLVREE
jgi:hypothetical protein